MNKNHFTNNRAQNGGAVWVYNGTLISSSCTWSKNSAVNSGGALTIYNSNYNGTTSRKRATGSSETISGDIFDGNNAYIGGAMSIYNGVDTPVVLTGVTMTKNTATSGGAIGLSGSLNVSRSHLQLIKLIYI